MKAAQQFRILEAVPCVHSQTELAKQSQKQLKRILKLEQPLSKAEQIKRDAKMLEDLVDTFKAKGYDNTKANAKANKFTQESFGRY
jgi:Spy/CpxP family protein refolding chaperone